MKLAKRGKESLGGFWRQSGRAIKRASKSTSTLTKNSLKKATHGPTSVARKFRGSKSKIEANDGKIVYQEPDGLGQILTIKVY